MSSRDSRDNGPIQGVIAAAENEAERGPRAPAELLAELMDLRGSVTLSDYITDVPVIPQAEPSHPEAVQALLAHGVEEVRVRLDFAIDNAYKPRFRLPPSSRAWSILDRSKILETFENGAAKERNAALRSGTRLIWASFAEFIETHLKRARFALRDLREELVGPLTGLGADVSRLERLDHALRAAIDSEKSKLYQRIGHHAERRFAAALRTALRELPDVADADAFALGFCQTGWLGIIFADAMAVVRGVIEHEIEQLENLVRNCLETYRTQLA
jgi:hypothetical protein